MGYIVSSTLASPPLTVVSQFCFQYFFGGWGGPVLSIGGLGQAPESPAFYQILLAGNRPFFGLQRSQSQVLPRNEDGFQSLKMFVLKGSTAPKPRLSIAKNRCDGVPRSLLDRESKYISAIRAFYTVSNWDRRRGTFNCFPHYIPCL